MANATHLAKIQQGAAAWNRWREEHPEIWPDLSGADLRQLDLSGINLMRVNLRQANLMACNLSGAYLSEAICSESSLLATNLSEAYLLEANLSRANLTGADLRSAYLGRTNLRGAYLVGANLEGADLRGAYLVSANLSEANLTQASLTQADLHNANLSDTTLVEVNLMGARLLKTNLEGANLCECRVYGMSAWELKATAAQQSHLLITPYNETAIAVNSLEIAQFLSLWLNSQILNSVIDAMTSRIVLIACPFNEQSRHFLEALELQLGQQGYAAIAVDLTPPLNANFATTFLNLAKIARLVLIDVFAPELGMPPELQDLLPQLHIPIQILVTGTALNSNEWDEPLRSPWLLPIQMYRDPDYLLSVFQERVLLPAEKRAQELCLDPTSLGYAQIEPREGVKRGKGP
ncbi:pentapeptide repeat-containing protein [Trichothermofontia sp.]